MMLLLMNRFTTLLVTLENDAASTEVIDSNQDKAVTIGSLRIDVPYDVHTPHREWPWSCHVVERN